METEFNDTIERRVIDERENTALENGQHIIIKCSACAEELVEIWVTRPEAKVVSEITVKCAHCGDKSFTKTVEGLFHLGHIASGRTRYNTPLLDTSVDDDGVVHQTIVIETVKEESE